MNQHWKINFTLLTAIMAIVTIAVLIVGTDILRDLKVKDAQINKLIDEVGALKGETPSPARSAAMKTLSQDQFAIDLAGTTGIPTAQAAENTKAQTVYLIVGQHSKLTDTIMVSVVDSQRKKVTLFSIPRDFHINGRKINEYYEFFGIQKLAEQITQITNLTIDKYVIVDMQSFKKFVDGIGGIDVNVEKGLVDTLYPTEKKGYQTFSISKGVHHMNGELALKYARSRETTSDFDRARRQQEVIKAIKQTLESKEDLIQLVGNIYDSIKGNIETNVSYIDAILSFNTVRGYTMSTNHVFSTANHLYSTHSTGGQYILLPKVKGYGEMQKAIGDWLNE